MKLAATLLLLIPVLTTLASPQAQQGPFSHIIIVVQENRTPDNLFGAGPAMGRCNQEHPFETGVDIIDGGNVYVNGQDQLQCFISLPLSGWDQSSGKIDDPKHDYPGFTADYRDTNMDGFCHGNGWSYPNCPPYSYVSQSDVQPYFDVATNYGFANYMFQSNEGLSFPAHQFLFTGTSAPVAPSYTCVDQNGFNCRDDFVQDNPDFTDSGCDDHGTPGWIEPNGTKVASSQHECFAHDTLVTISNHCNGGHDSCDRGFSWAWYTPPDLGVIWDAPLANPEVCYGQSSNQNQFNPCSGSEYTDHVRILNHQRPYGGLYSNAAIFDDLYNCYLPAVSWVIPDGLYSDHPRDGLTNPPAYGPSWVGDIIDAVGGGMQGSTCNNLGSGKYWSTEPTAILVVWDDWGGWYDHIKPWVARKKGTESGYTDCDENGSEQYGCGYTDGFRVPFLVVSEYTGTYSNGQFSSYVSGACGQGETNQCPFFGQNNVYVHDFGSILAYTEWNFGIPQIDLTAPGYADSNAPDSQNGNVPLSDFFGLWNGGSNPNPRPFVSITTSVPTNCFQYPVSCTTTPGMGSGWQPSPPDTD